MQLLAAGAIAAVAIVAGCATVDERDRSDDDLTWIDPGYRPEVLRTRMNEFVNDFGATVERAANEVIAQADDPAVVRAALLWKVNALPAARKASFRFDPLAACVDAWTFVAQMDAFVRTGEGRALFGEGRPIVLAATGTLLEEIRSIARTAMASEDELARIERTVVEPWVRDHPIADLGLARPSSIMAFAELTVQRAGALRSVVSLEEQVDILAAQARLYLADATKILRWEAELIRHELLYGEGADALLADVATIADAADRAADTAVTVPGLVRDERAIVLEALDRQRALVLAEIDRQGALLMDEMLGAIDEQRALVMADVGLERAALVDGLAEQRGAIVEAIIAERQAVIEALADERVLVLEAITREREAVLADIDDQRLATLRWLEGERDVVLAGVHDGLVSVADRVMLRAALLLVLAVVLAPVVAHVYVRVWPRRPAVRG